MTATAEYRHRGSGSGTGTGRMANESMSAIENVDGLDDGMADGMELLPPPETAPAPASAGGRRFALRRTWRWQRWARPPPSCWHYDVKLVPTEKCVCAGN